VVHDLCVAYCGEESGARTPALAARIAELEARLDHECGSGRPAPPGAAPPRSPAPAPNPVDRLLL
jgi:hypothetical protein